MYNFTNYRVDFFLRNLGVEDKEELRPLLEKMTILRDKLDNYLTTNDLKNLPIMVCDRD